MFVQQTNRESDKRQMSIFNLISSEDQKISRAFAFCFCAMKRIAISWPKFTIP